MNRLAAPLTALVAGALSAAAAIAQEQGTDHWLVNADARAAYFLDASTIEADASGIVIVWETIVFRGNPRRIQMNTLEVNCAEGKTRVAQRAELEGSILRPNPRLGDEARWSAPAPGDARGNEIAFACGAESERTTNPNWRRVADPEQAAREVFSDRRR
jgi:hypothetical protein